MLKLYTIPPKSLTGELDQGHEFMFKKILVLIVMAWAGLTYSYEFAPKKETLEDSENYKLDKGIKEIINQRSLAGSKIKKNKLKEDEEAWKDKANSDELDSEVRFWEYSE
jgi:hypothetical protein